MSKVVHVVLSGGVGSRMWPLSRKSKPKQYLDIFSGNSLFENTIIRNKSLCDQLIIVGNVDNIQLSEKSLQKLEIKNAVNIIEAAPRNTAAAIAFAAFACNSDDVLVVTPSDHVIMGEELYRQSVQQAIEKAQKGAIVTFGIKPVKPETGYGYIEFKEDRVLSFREKPNLETAESFLKKGNFYWNSGMFCFKAGVFLSELEKYEPELFLTSKLVWDNNIDGNLDLESSLQIPSISVDYAVMERSKKIKVVASSFDWSDLGSFESIYEYLIKMGHSVDENGNMVIGTNIFTSFVGLKNCIFVFTNDAFLILQKEKSQDVKKVYQYLESINSNLA